MSDQQIPDVSDMSMFMTGSVVKLEVGGDAVM
jgi:hypothetical protein